MKQTNAVEIDQRASETVLPPREMQRLARQCIHGLHGVARLNGIDREDMSAEAAAAIAEHRPEFPGQAYLIGRRAVMRMLRQAHVRQRGRLYPLPGAAEEDETSEDWLDRYRIKSSSQDNSLIDSIAVREVVDRLPHNQRRAIICTYWAGEFQSEIGIQGGCSGAHVSRLLKRALGRMREDLEGLTLHANTPRVDNPQCESEIDIQELLTFRSCTAVVESVSSSRNADYLDAARRNRERIAALQCTESSQPRTVKGRMMLYLQQHGPSRIADIARNLGVDYNTVYDDSRYLTEDGELIRLADGTYSLPVTDELQEAA